MTARELSTAIGREADYRANNMMFRVKVIDAKMSYGRPLLQITPAAGMGATWVTVDSLRIKEPETAGTVRAQ